MTSIKTEDVEAVARAINPEAWAYRDTDLTRRDEWEREIKVGWGDTTFEEWCDRFIGKSLEQARAALSATPIERLREENARRGEALEHVRTRLDACDDAWRFDELIAEIDAALTPSVDDAK